jgi:hypothetical protein
MRIYNDPFEQLLADVIQDCAEEMNKIQPQDLTFIPRVVYLKQTDKETQREQNNESQDANIQ